MKPLPRAIFGLFAFLPAMGVLAVAVLFSSFLTSSSLMTRPNHLSASQQATLIGAGLGTLAIAFLQIILGIVVAIQTSGRRDMTSNEKAAWSLACLFVGSIALPMFFFMKSKPVPT